MNYEHFWIALCPNIVVFLMASVAFYTTIVYAFPQIISKSLNPGIVYFIFFIAILSFSMFAWCWVYTISSDPGRIADDLHQRGLLNKIIRGDIPKCLQSFPVCEKCHVPMPLKSFHCDICHSCHLRYDHHCGVVGQCIADKNTKSFILSFFYASIYGIIATFVCFHYAFKLNSHNLLTLDASEILVFVIGIYCALISICMVNFVFSMLLSEAVFLSKIHKSITFSKMLKFFGNNWYTIFIPIQKQASPYAWPNVFWYDDSEL